MLLETPRLLLRELAESDAAAANRYESDPEVMRYMAYEDCTLEDSREYLAGNVFEIVRRPRLVFDLGIVPKSAQDGGIVGRVGLRLTSAYRQEATLWFLLRRECWGLGYATEASRAMVAFAFQELRVHRVQADCDPRNLRSAHVLEKLGMTREGHLRENLFIRGEWCDAMLFSVLAHEWVPMGSEPPF